MAHPAELDARRVVGQKLELGAGAVGGGYLAGFLTCCLYQTAVHAAALHAVGVVYIYAYRRAAACHLSVLVGDDWLAESQNQEDNGQDACRQYQQLPEIPLATVLALQFLQHFHIAEIHFAVAAQLKQVDGYGNAHSRKADEK